MLEKRILTKDAFSKKEVVVAGWVEEYRDLKKIKFIILRDSSGTIQITMPKSKVDSDVFDIELTKESIISVSGEMVPSKEARGGKELIPKAIEVIAKAETPLPIDISGKIETDLSKRLDWRSIDLRQRKIRSCQKKRTGHQSKKLNKILSIERNKKKAGAESPCQEDI